MTVLPSSVQQRVRQGQLSAQVATKYLVPLARANSTHCEGVVRHLEGRRPSVREMKRLYVAWRAGDAEQRQRIVDHPQLFFRATDEEAEQDETKLLVRDLRTLGALSQRCERRIEAGAWKGATAAEQHRLWRAWGHAARSFASLRTAAEPWEAAHAGPRHARGDCPPAS